MKAHTHLSPSPSSLCPSLSLSLSLILPLSLPLSCLHIVCILTTDYHSLQVFHVPVEERRYNFDEPSFGGGESRQLDIVREIMERTGCDIEMSQTKDRALTIMVTGKPPSVLKARKDLLQKLQTQVRK